MKLLEQSVSSLQGITLHTIPTTKYKTNTIALRLKAPLQKEDVSYRALLPYVLQSGTEGLTTATKIRQHLEELYGAGLSVDVTKKGEYHIISLYIDIVNEKYLQDNTPLFEKALSLLSDILLRPYTENGVFAASIIENEKRSLIQRIQSIYDDKMRYANERLLQEMCKDEAYGINALGIKEDIEKIDAASLYQFYQKILQDNEIDMYIIGDIDEEQCKEKVSEYFPLPRREKITLPPIVHKEVVEKEIIEEQDIHQGKLHMGYRTGITYCDKEYYALQMFNGIYGGFSHSKLFINVREKNSLAYYAASRYESHKGLLMVMAGIESSNYQKAVTIIKEQLDEIRNGNFTDEEISQTKAVMRNQILETIDTARGLTEIFYHEIIAGCSRTIQDWLEGIEKVTREEIIAVANKVQLDTVYFLKER